jgi:hypothetical protein
MTSDLEVDADAVRGGASAVAGTAHRMAGGAPPPAAVTVPRWAATGAAETLADATGRLLATVVADLEADSRRLTAVADDYRAADDRAAARLKAVA